MSGTFLRVNGTNVVKGAGRMMVADLEATHPTAIADVIALAAEVGPPVVDLYDPTEDWADLGATTGGIVITRGFETEGYSVDQVQGDLGEDVTGWTNTIETSLAETTPDNFQLAWVGSAITEDTTVTTNDESTIHFGDPDTIPQRKLAVLFQDRYGYIRLYAFRLVQRSGDDSALTHEKGGDPLALPLMFRAFPDTTVADRDSRVFTIIQQLSTTTA